MATLNLKKMIPGLLWVDEENGVLVRFYATASGTPRFYAESHKESVPFVVFEDAKEYLEKQLSPTFTTTLEGRDREWIELISRNYHPHEGGLRGTYLRGAQEGIHHERDRVRLALDELLFRGPHCAKSDLLLAVRRHLGLEEPN